MHSSSPVKVKEDDEVDNLDIKLDVKRKTKRIYQSSAPEVNLKISRTLKVSQPLCFKFLLFNSLNSFSPSLFHPSINDACIPFDLQFLTQQALQSPNFESRYTIVFYFLARVTLSPSPNHSYAYAICTFVSIHRDRYEFNLLCLVGCLQSLNAKTGIFSKRMKIIHKDPMLHAQRVAAIKVCCSKSSFTSYILKCSSSSST